LDRNQRPASIGIAVRNHRNPHLSDRRSVIVKKTSKGSSHLGTLNGYMNAVSKAADKQAKK